MSVTAHAAPSAPPAHWPEKVEIATASHGGTYVRYGKALARLIRDRLGVSAHIVVTGGPEHNMALVNSGKYELGFVTLGPAHDAWTGRSPLAHGIEMRDVRALFPMYMTPFQLFVRDGSRARDVSALDGLTVGLGPHGGTAAAFFPRFLETLGVTIKRRFGPAEKLADALGKGKIDAFAFAAGVPVPTMRALAKDQPIRLFGFDNAQISRLTNKFLTVTPFRIPGGTYPGTGTDVTTVDMWNFAIAHESVPDDFVRRLLEVVFTRRAEMVEGHPAAAETRPENLVHNRVLWLHPGAVRYYRERHPDLLVAPLPPTLRPSKGGGATTEMEP